jgi:hypothetical protein
MDESLALTCARDSALYLGFDCLKACDLGLCNSNLFPIIAIAEKGAEEFDLDGDYLRWYIVVDACSCPLRADAHGS